MQRIIDLTLTLKSGMRGVSFEPCYRVADKGWNAQTLHLYSHCGTHMDAPCHFNVNKTGIHAIPLERCMVRAAVIHLPDLQPNQDITLDHIQPMAELVRPGEGILFHSGWSRYVDDPIYRQGQPGLHPELAQWMVDRQVGLVGVDMGSVYCPLDLVTLTRVHTLLLQANIIIVEGLTHLGQIKESRVRFMALPLPIYQGDGAPVRALAIEGE